QHVAGLHAVQAVEALADVAGGVHEPVGPRLDVGQVPRVVGALVDQVLPVQVQPGGVAPAADGAGGEARHRRLHHGHRPVGVGRGLVVHLQPIHVGTAVGGGGGGPHGVGAG